MQEWMDSLTQAVNEIPFISSISYSDNTGPNSRYSAYPGSIAIESASSASHRAWLKVSGYTSSEWTPFALGVNSDASTVHGDVFGWGYITFSNKTFTSTSTRYPFSYVSYNKMTVATTSVNSIRAQETGLYRCSAFVKALSADDNLYGMLGLSFGNNDLPLGLQVSNIRFWNDPTLQASYYLTTHMESVASLVAGDSVWDRMEFNMFWDQLDGATSIATLTGDVHVLVQKIL